MMTRLQIYDVYNVKMLTVKKADILDFSLYFREIFEWWGVTQSLTYSFQFCFLIQKLNSGSLNSGLFTYLHKMFSLQGLFPEYLLKH